MPTCAAVAWNAPWVNALPVATTPEPAPKASTAPTAAAYHSVPVSNALKVGPAMKPAGYVRTVVMALNAPRLNTA